MPEGTVKRQPETDMGRCLQRAIAEILGLKSKAIGLDDDFLRLGGNCISAMKLISRLRDMNVSLLVSDILQNPLVEAMADGAMSYSNTHSNGHAGERPFSMLPCGPFEIAQKLGIPVDGISDALPATQVQETMLRYPPRFLITRSPGPVDTKRLEAACQKLVERHSILRTVFVDYDVILFQAILREAAIPFEHHECHDGYQDMARF